ncbi:MAG: LysR family transcriptional regulator [Rhodobacteraceae bacterium]|nr:LysR family transcriptional regulator [Paracoccaceae bacterium]
MDGIGFDHLPLEWVRAFETAARRGSFTAAAAEIGLTQSAISQRIAHLERRLGTRLFIRQARRIQLTTEGEAWLPHVQVALARLRDSSEALFGLGKRQLAISASASIIELWLVPRLARLTALTQAQVTLRTMVLTGDAEGEDETIRVRYGAGDWSAGWQAPLYSEALAPVAAPGLVGPGDEWRAAPRLAVAGPRPGWTEWSARMGGPATPVAALRFDTFSAALAAARAGLGVLLASLPLVARDLEDGRLQRLTGTTMSHHETYWLLASRDRLSRRLWESLCAALLDDTLPQPASRDERTRQPGRSLA